MRVAILLLALAAGCSSPAGELLTPDEFHFWGQYGKDEYSSEFNRPGSPTGGFGSGSGNQSAIGAGLTWHLTQPSTHNLEALRELQRITATLVHTRADLATFTASATAAAPVYVVPSPQTPPADSWRVPMTAAPSDAHSHDPAGAQPVAGLAADEPPEEFPEAVALFEKIWAKLGGGVFLLIMAAIAWLNRQRLPWARNGVDSSHETPPDG